jgi:hypothetical protein
MKRKHSTLFLALVSICGLVRCGSSSDGAPPSTKVENDGGPQAEAGSVVDAEDPRCQTPAVLVTTHPHASQQDATTVGHNLIDTRGFHGRLYFGYGDLNWNTGPIVISSYDPITNTWTDHLTFDTERIERLRVIGDQLWAPASDPSGEADPEYAIGTEQHVWSQHSIGRSIKVLDVAERVPGDVFLVGSDLYISDAGTFDKTFGGAVWRSQNGAAFQRVFPMINPDPIRDYEYLDLNELPFLNAAALNGTLYTATVAPPWTFDGTEWAKGLQLGGFLHPVTFAGHIVFAALGELWAFDGTNRKSLGIQLVNTTLAYTFVKDPIAILTDSEDRILVVNSKLETLVTKDLVEWKCIGHAPPDVRSVGSLNGRVFFGASSGHVYGFATPSW